MPRLSEGRVIQEFGASSVMGSGASHRRLIRQVHVLLLALAASTLASAQGPLDTLRNPRLKKSVGYSMDMEYAADMILTVVKNVASSGVIHGTKIYRKDKEDQVEGADFATSSKAFNDSPGSGQVFYKVRKGAVAPEHFPGSTGEGTITVRYVVQAGEGQPIHLRIDAVYVEDSLRARYFSDGTVEAAEYNEIQTQLNAFTAPADERQAVAVSYSSSRDQGAPAPENKVLPAAKTLPIVQGRLAEEQTLLADATAQKQKLEEQLKQLEFNTQGLVKSLAVPLKSYPYNSSSSVLTLGKEEKVTVLTTSRYWYRVRAPNGEEGWIYYMFVEPLPK